MDGGLDGLAVLPGHEVTVEGNLHQGGEQALAQDGLAQFHELRGEREIKHRERPSNSRCVKNCMFGKR